MQQEIELMPLDDDVTDLKFVEHQENLRGWALRLTIGKFINTEEENKLDSDYLVDHKLKDPYTKWMVVFETGRDPPTSHHLHYYFESSKSETTLRTMVKEFIENRKNLDLEKILSEEQKKGKKNGYYSIKKCDDLFPLKYFNYSHKENTPVFHMFTETELKTISAFVDSNIAEQNEKKKLRKIKGGVMQQMIAEFEQDDIKYPDVHSIIKWVQQYYDKHDKIIMLSHMVNQAMTLANKYAPDYKSEIGQMILERMSSRK